MIQEISNMIRQIEPQVPHDANVTDRFFKFIEANPSYLNQYHCLCHAYGRRNINRWAGKLIKDLLHLQNYGTSPASSKLIKTYTLH